MKKYRRPFTHKIKCRFLIASQRRRVTAVTVRPEGVGHGHGLIFPAVVGAAASPLQKISEFVLVKMAYFGALLRTVLVTCLSPQPIV